MKNKKGNINELLPAVMGIILVGALIFVGILVLSNLQDVTYLNTAVTSINESLAQPTTEGITLAVGNAARNGVCGAVTNILNHTTGNVVIGLGNITQTSCIVKNATDWADYGANVRYTYPYTYDNATLTTTSITSVNTSIGTIATTWVPIIIVVLAAGIVLAILLGSFGRKKK